MAKEQETDAIGHKEMLREKLAQIRNHLMGSPTAEELQLMQLHMNALDRWAQLIVLPTTDAGEHHHHDDVPPPPPPPLPFPDNPYLP
jgi:hypothetical protein